MKSKINKVFVVTFVLAAMALLLIGSLRPAAIAWAQTAQTIILISGNGPIGSRDAVNQFTMDGGVTWQDAYIIAPQSAYHVIPGTQYINLNPNPSGPTFTATRYRTSFELPAGFRNPALTVEVHADNVATIFLNGVQIGQQQFAEIFANFQNPAESFTTTDPSLFVAGTNVLEFEIYNFTLFTGFDYKAVVSYDSALQVTLDIKPGDPANNVNPRSNGQIPVAVLTTATFDAATLDTNTLRFGQSGTEAAPAHTALEDVDGDNNLDLMLHFKTQETGITCGDTIARLTGTTIANATIEGSDMIHTVGCK